MTEADATRHDLLRLTDEGWGALAARHAALAETSGIRLWAAQGFPVMRRRRQAGDQAEQIPVAVALPTSLGRSRLAFQVAPADVATVERPPLLQEALSSLPERLTSRAQAVLAVAGDIALTPRLFGSAMWQHVTGLGYLHDRSDLDLLWNIPLVPDPASLIARLVSSLQGLDAGLGARLDGEIVLRQTAGAQWRELLSGAADALLVKTTEDVMLMSRSRFLQQATASC